VPALLAEGEEPRGYLPSHILFHQWAFFPGVVPMVKIPIGKPRSVGALVHNVNAIADDRCNEAAESRNPINFGMTGEFPDGCSFDGRYGILQIFVHLRVEALVVNADVVVEFGDEVKTVNRTPVHPEGYTVG